MSDSAVTDVVETLDRHHAVGTLPGQFKSRELHDFAIERLEYNGDRRMARVPQIQRARSAHSGDPPVTKAQRVFLDLRAKILSGDIGPKTRLTLRPLASQYGTGINAVSEAVKALAAEGLVELEGQAGAEVIARDLNRIRGEFILRIALECETARRCAEKADRVELEMLERMALKVDRLFAEGEQLAECRQADVKFHLAVADVSGAPQLKETLRPLLDRLVMLDQTEQLTADIPGQKHQEVFEGLKSRDPVVASDMMRLHLEHSMNLSLALLEVD